MLLLQQCCCAVGSTAFPKGRKELLRKSCSGRAQGVCKSRSLTLDRSLARRVSSVRAAGVKYTLALTSRRARSSSGGVGPPYYLLLTLPAPSGVDFLSSSFFFLHSDLPCFDRSGHDQGVDWWALGVLMFEMMAGSSPFYHADDMTMFRRIVDNKYSFNQARASPRQIPASLRQISASLRQISRPANNAVPSLPVVRSAAHYYGHYRRARCWLAGS